VQVIIYEVDLAYQPDGRLAVDANAGEACDIPDRATSVWRMEESSRHIRIDRYEEVFRHMDTKVSLRSTNQNPVPHKHIKRQPWVRLCQRTFRPLCPTADGLLVQQTTGAKSAVYDASCVR